MDQIKWYHKNCAECVKHRVTCALCRREERIWQPRNNAKKRLQVQARGLQTRSRSSGLGLCHGDRTWPGQDEDWCVNSARHLTKCDPKKFIFFTTLVIFLSKFLGHSWELAVLFGSNVKKKMVKIEYARNENFEMTDFLQHFIRIEISLPANHCRVICWKPFPHWKWQFLNLWFNTFA